MGVMPVKKLLVSMSLPMMASMLVQALYNIVDSIFVSRVSENALTAVSMAFPLQTLMIALAGGTCVGINAILSKALGEKDFAKAAEWYQKALDSGKELDAEARVRAQYYLGMLYLDGKGVTRDEEAAAALIGRSAEDGFAKAQYQMGLLCEAGRGVERDEDAARRWYELAAEQDYAAAKEKLAG